MLETTQSKDKENDCGEKRSSTSKSRSSFASASKAKYDVGKEFLDQVTSLIEVKLEDFKEELRISFEPRAKKVCLEKEGQLEKVDVKPGPSNRNCALDELYSFLRSDSEDGECSNSEAVEFCKYLVSCYRNQKT